MYLKSYKYLLILLLSSVLLSCNTDENFSASIFETNIKSDPSSASYAFDTWLHDSYLVPYNLDFRYRMQDVGSDQDYNLVPTSLAKAQQMAKLVKYLWFDVYGTIVSPEFLKENGPRIIHLIGSPAYNPISGTILLGTAEGGLKVTLYNCNALDPSDVDILNEYYFKTMHHEFAHILHQKRNYPVEFGLISQGKYNPLGWQYRTDSEAATLGFVSPYAGSQNREDFVEIIANYLVKSDAQWNNILLMASQNGVTTDAQGNTITLPDDGIDGKALILEKLTIARKWLKTAWSIDIDALRAEIIKREANIEQVIK
jgi:substrate import-associated zinc metallohydrolase lipoprotein